MGQYNITTPNGSFTIEADRQPSQQEADAIGKQFTDGEAKDKEVKQKVAEESSGFVDAATSLAFDTIPSLIGGSVGYILGKGKGAMVGSTMGGGLGNWAKQQLEIAQGKRDEVSTGQVVANAVSSATFTKLLPATAWKASTGTSNIIRRIAIDAADSALIATTAEIAKSELDEGKLPSFTRLAEVAVPSAVLGGATGAIINRYQTNGKLITNAAVAQGVRGAAGLGTAAVVYNDAVNNGETNALPKALLLGATVYAAGGVPAFLAKQNIENVKLKLLGPEFVTPKKVSRELESFNNKLAAAKYRHSQIASLANVEVAKAANPTQAAADLLSVIDGTASRNILSEDLRGYADEFRRINIEFSEEIAKMPNLPDELKATINNQKGSYLRTVYAAHDPRAKFGVDYATPADSAAFKKEIVSGFVNDEKKLSVAEAEKKADAIMSRMLGDVQYVYSGGASVASGKGVATSALSRTGDISEAGKLFLGEVKDPGQIMANSLDAQARIVLEHNRDKAISEMLLDPKLGSLGSKTKSQYHTDLMIGSEAPIMHSPLAGLYTSVPVAQAYKELMNPHLLGDGTVAKTWMKVVGLSKASKTLGNVPEAFAPQMIGDMAIAASSFKANPMDIYDGFKKTFYANGWSGKGHVPATTRIKALNEINEAMSFGALKAGADVQQVKDMLSGVAEGKGLDEVINKLSRVYGAPDSAFRYAIWKQNVEEILSWTPAAKQTEDGIKAIKAKAADLTNDHFPTYERILRRYRQASAIGMANQFGAFEFEMFRNTANQLSYAGKLIREGIAQNNSKMQVAGYKRLMSFAAVAGTTTGLAIYGSRQLFNTTDEDAANIRKIIPTRDQDKTVMSGTDGKGHIVYAPMNYLLPHSNMIGAAADLVNGRPFYMPVKSSLLGNDIGVLQTGLVEGITGNFYGTRVAITNPRDNVELAERFAIQAFMPGVITGTVNRMLKAVKNETTKLGNVYQLKDSLGRLAGARLNRVDIIGSASVRLRDIVDPIVSEQTGYRQILKSYQARTGDDKFTQLNEQGLYDKANRSYIQQQGNLADIYVAMKGMQKKNPSITDEKIVQAFKDAGVPTKLILAAIGGGGYVVQMSRGLEDNDTEFIEGVLADPEKAKQIMPMLKARSGGDPYKLQQLQQTFTDVKKNQILKVGPKSKLLAGLDVLDGSRAIAMWSDMHANPATAKDLYRGWIKDGILTNPVLLQLRKLDAAEAKRLQGISK